MLTKKAENDWGWLGLQVSTSGGVGLIGGFDSLIGWAVAGVEVGSRG